jgi:hypothetical protein
MCLLVVPFSVYHIHPLFCFNNSTALDTFRLIDPKAAADHLPSFKHPPPSSSSYHHSPSAASSLYGVTAAGVTIPRDLRPRNDGDHSRSYAWAIYSAALHDNVTEVMAQQLAIVHAEAMNNTTFLELLLVGTQTVAHRSIGHHRLLVDALLERQKFHPVLRYLFSMCPSSPAISYQIVPLYLCVLAVYGWMYDIYRASSSS